LRKFYYTIYSIQNYINFSTKEQTISLKNAATTMQQQMEHRLIRLLEYLQMRKDEKQIRAWLFILAK
jgi:hypothetical protein